MEMDMVDMSYEPPDFYEFEVSPYPVNSPPPVHPVMPLPHAVNRFSDLTSDRVPIEHLKSALVAAAVLSFIFLIAKDAHKAFTRRAHWIPCDFLVLSAFSIQMLSMLNTQNQALEASSPTAHWLSIKADTAGNAPQYAGWKDILMIHNSRTILCVFTAYVMPAMADRGLEHAWVRCVALVITVFHHVTSQYYSIKGKTAHGNASPSSGTGNSTLSVKATSSLIDNHSMVSANFRRLWPQPNSNGSPEAPYYIYATLVSLCFILLILLLACATIAGRSIERIVSKKISLVLRGEREFSAGLAKSTQEAHPQHHSSWRNVKIDVNKADHPHYHLHHVHDHHSCVREVEEAALRAGKADEINHHHSCWRTVEDAVLRVEKGEEINHSCWQTVEDAVARGEKEEEEELRRHCHRCWRSVEDEVLKAWIIVRAYSVQPVLARSALTAAAAIIVTIQIVITLVGGFTNVFKNDRRQDQKNTFKLVATIVQSVFILMAWALINLRWATALTYHRRSQKDKWRSGLKIEDFWTRHLEELQQAEETPLEEVESLAKEIDQLVSRKQQAPVLPGIFWSAVIGMQWLLVLFCKACWLVSLMIFHNKLMLKLFRYMFEKHILCVFEDYPKYAKILEEVQMLGESPESLWVSNRKSIQQAKRVTIQGNQDGQYNCDDLVEFLINKRSPKGVGLSCLEPYKSQSELKFLCKKRPIQRTQQPREEIDVEKGQSRERKKGPFLGEEQFTDMTMKSWKMAAVSLLSIIFHLSPIYAELDKEHCSTSHDYPPEAVMDCFKAYSQAWEIIDFVEEAADIEAEEVSEITSEAADKQFKLLQQKVEKGDFPRDDFRHATPACVRSALEGLKNQNKSKIERLQSVNSDEKVKTQRRRKGWEGNDSMDWKESALGNAMYKLCDSIECTNETDVTELLKELENSLADIINECLEKTQNLLLLNSRKWALERDEKRMGKALYTTGKAKAIVEKLAGNRLAIVSNH